MKYRSKVLPSDRAQIAEITESTGFFRPAEVEIAVSLADEYLQKGENSGYHFVFAEEDGLVLGYTCFGPIPCTISSHDLYWIVVRPDCQGQGLGHRLLGESERKIHQLGGTRVYIETSSHDHYEPTRRFYLGCGYKQAAELEDFYAPGDGKIIYVKELPKALTPL